MLVRLLFVVTLASFSLFAQEEEKDIAKISEAFGHLLGNNIETIGVEFDIDLVVKGLKDASNGKNAPMSGDECLEAISFLRENSLKELAETNLKKAEEFLKQNAKEKNIVTLDEGKLQYKIEKKGNGPQVDPHSNPVIHYTGKYLDGKIFGQSTEAEILSLDETIQGFSKGLVGMQEGEKRTLYIHPDYGYGVQGFVPPNSLLTFEIEIVNAEAPEEKATDSLILESDRDSKSPPDLDAPSIR